MAAYSAAPVRVGPAALGLAPLHHVVVSGRGELPGDSPVWDGPATVVTTPAGLARLRLPSSVDVVVDDTADGRVSPLRILDVARERTPVRLPSRAPGVVLLEPGPGFFSELLGAGLVDELCLTLSLLLAGVAPGRLGLVEGPAGASLALAGLARAGSHLFTRWRGWLRRSSWFLPCGEAGTA